VKAAGIKVAVASSADRIKVDANLAAAGIPLTLYASSHPSLAGPLASSVLHTDASRVTPAPVAIA